MGADRLGKAVAAFFLLAAACCAEDIRLAGLERPVEILRDRWGVPHIYAQSANDLFFAQGYMAARDRLWQLDMWRRTGTGKLAEVVGPGAVARDRMARLLRFRGDWKAEWQSYSPDSQRIATAFTAGINAYIRGLNGKRPVEFQAGGYDPGLWAPEDCTSRVASLGVMRNVQQEVARVISAAAFGIPAVEKYDPPDPLIKLELPRGLNLADVPASVLADFRAVSGPVRMPGEQGSNNWVVDGTMTASGKPLLANDPHRALQIPSLRRTVHLVGPGWNAIGAGEPALPGIALGHNEEIAFGFTIVGIDQQDLYVEKLNPRNPNEYLYRGEYRPFEMEKETIAAKGGNSHPVELKYSIHGPILHEDRAKGLAYALKWIGSEPGSAGYLAALAVARTKNWTEFRKAMENYKVPSENMVYADRAGNIGWIASGAAPVRKNWTGLFPVPGHTGEYEWSGFARPSETPSAFNPPKHFIATANHNILPPDYKGPPLSYEWAAPFRFQRVEQMLSGKQKLTVADFERMQLDVVSLPAHRFQAIIRKWQPAPGTQPAKFRDMVLAWDARLSVDSVPASVYKTWTGFLSQMVLPRGAGPRADIESVLKILEGAPMHKELETTLEQSIRELERSLGPDSSKWTWGRIHHANFQHPIAGRGFDRGPVPRPGDPQTVNAAGGGLQQTSGASYRQILDLADWDRSVISNVPGEVGDPRSPHYSDLLDDWTNGRFHPLPYTRRAVEDATVERIRLLPN